MNDVGVVDASNEHGQNEKLMDLYHRDELEAKVVEYYNISRCA